MNSLILVAARHLATGVCLISSCLAGDEYAPALDVFRRTAPEEFAAHLDRTRPARLSENFKARVIESLPKEGEANGLTPEQKRKLASLTRVMRAHEREGEYLVKVVDLPQAHVGIHARFVVLITLPALTILTAEQLQAALAHEVGHDYIWVEFQEASKRNDWSRRRELELICDGIAMLTMARLGSTPKSLTDSVRLMDGYNRARGIRGREFSDSHPTVSERIRFGVEIAKWLRQDVIP